VGGGVTGSVKRERRRTSLVIFAIQFV
jgi:hypothetical protein